MQQKNNWLMIKVFRRKRRYELYVRVTVTILVLIYVSDIYLYSGLNDINGKTSFWELDDHVMSTDDFFVDNPEFCDRQ